MNSVTIWDTENSPSTNLEGSVVLWRLFSLPSHPEAISLPSYIEDHADVLRQKLVRLVFEIGASPVDEGCLIDSCHIRPRLSYWWMTLIHEKCNVSKSPYISDIIKAFAFESWLDENVPNAVTLVSANKSLAEVMTQTFQGTTTKFVWVKIADSRKRVGLRQAAINLAPKSLQALAWLATYIIRNFL